MSDWQFTTEIDVNGFSKPIPIPEWRPCLQSSHDWVRFYLAFNINAARCLRCGVVVMPPLEDEFVRAGTGGVQP